MYVVQMVDASHCLFCFAARVPDARCWGNAIREVRVRIFSRPLLLPPSYPLPPSFSPVVLQTDQFSSLTHFQFLRSRNSVNNPFVLSYSCTCPIIVSTYIHNLLLSLSHTHTYILLRIWHIINQLCRRAPLARFLLPVQTAGMKLKLSNIQRPPTLC